jgi:multidrug efflux system membrane fusion protein
MTHPTITQPDTVERTSEDFRRPGLRSRRRRYGNLAVGLLVVIGATAGGLAWKYAKQSGPQSPPPPPPEVTVAPPVQRTIAATRGFLGQFSAVENVELRAQVGGTLAAIDFRDGQVVQKGEPLFLIDPRPFQIRLDQAVAQLQTAEARKALADAELWRAQQLKQTSFGTAETVDQRAADQRSAQAAIETAKAAIRDAQLDLEFARINAPFTGRIGAHLVSVGSLVSGSRGGAGPTTLLATVVSLDPIYLDFDMSEADYLAYQAAHRGARQPEDVAIDLSGNGHYDRHGTLDFIDNAVNRSSGTIHARTTVPNPDLSVTPGQFARLLVPTGSAAPMLLVPPTAIVPDQSREIVMTVAPDGTVVPKPVETDGLYQGLRIIRSGLDPSDRVVIRGLVRVRPGAKVTPVAGTITPDPNAAGST